MLLILANSRVACRPFWSGADVQCAPNYWKNATAAPLLNFCHFERRHHQCASFRALLECVKKKQDDLYTGYRGLSRVVTQPGAATRKVLES